MPPNSDSQSDAPQAARAWSRTLGLYKKSDVRYRRGSSFHPSWHNFRWCGRAASAARVPVAVLARRTPKRSMAHWQNRQCG